MVKLQDANSLLSEIFGNGDSSSLEKALPERDQSAYRPLDRFRLEKGRQYQQQFSDMYFLRLNKIKPAVEKLGAEAFSDIVIGGEATKKVERVLDVRQGELCWVVGTIFMDMPFKPNILEDVSKDKLLSKPDNVPKYIPADEDDLLAEGRGSVAIMLEDDSGRIRLVGKPLTSLILVTGCIVAVMGTENENGELEVIDIMFPDLAPQPARWTLSKQPADNKSDGDVDMAESIDSSSSSRKIAIVSGLGFSGLHARSAVDSALLLEYLLGEALTPGVVQTGPSRISRLIIAGNSICDPISAEAAAAEAAAATATATGETATEAVVVSKKYGYDSSAYNPVPSAMLDDFLAELLPSMPVTLLPGQHDPANTSLPQQPVHAAMFPKARAFSPTAAGEPGWLDAVTNPWEGEVDGWRFLGTSGQTIDDIQKYVQSNDRLSMMEATCRWRCSAPTAPDTLWSYPFQEDDPFVMESCPHLYFVGSQPEFGTRLITGMEGQTVRLVSVPAFSETGEIVLVDAETLDVTRVKIGRA